MPNADRPEEVSIPAGFSDALRQDLLQSSSGGENRFQSLLGFLMRCDLPVSAQVRSVRQVSIPAGFSDALRHFAECC